jgi:hypothetical protein
MEDFQGAAASQVKESILDLSLLSRSERTPALSIPPNLNRGIGKHGSLNKRETNVA